MGALTATNIVMETLRLLDRHEWHRPDYRWKEETVRTVMISTTTAALTWNLTEFSSRVLKPAVGRLVMPGQFDYNPGSDSRLILTCHTQYGAREQYDGFMARLERIDNPPADQMTLYLQLDVKADWNAFQKPKEKRTATGVLCFSPSSCSRSEPYAVFDRGTGIPPTAKVTAEWEE